MRVECKGCPRALDEIDKNILIILSGGGKTKEIALELAISEASVKRRINKLMDWFDAKNRVHLVFLTSGIINEARKQY